MAQVEPSSSPEPNPTHHRYPEIKTYPQSRIATLPQPYPYLCELKA